MTVRFDSSTRAALDKLAERTGFVHANGKPRLAELVRVLLISAIYFKQPVSSRVAYALYSNGVMSLSKSLTLMLMSLRDDIAIMAKRAARSKDATEPPAPDVERLDAECAICNNVFLILDDWTHDGLSELLATFKARGAEPEGIDSKERRLLDQKAREYRKPHGDMILVRDLVGMALDNVENHMPVIERYIGTIARVEESVSKVIADERAALVTAIAGIGAGG